MLLNRQDKITKIDMYLSILKYYISFQNKAGKTDINHYSEDFIKEILNIIFNLELLNLNDIKHNHTAIDLGDKENKECFQITSTNESGKIKESLIKYENESYYNDYNKVRFIILNDKPGSYSFTILDISFKFDYNDIYDINDLSNEIKRLDENKINQIYDYMNKQFQPLRGIFEDSIFYEKIDNGNLKFPSNYDAYINYLNKDMSKDDKAQTIKDIREFGKKLSSITPQNRDILFTCIENRINDDGWNINFLISDIRQRYTRNINDNIYSLMKHKFIELKEDSGNDYDVIAYNFEHSNILLDLLKYCEANNKNLKNILVNLDFSELE